MCSFSSVTWGKNIFEFKLLQIFFHSTEKITSMTCWQTRRCNLMCIFRWWTPAKIIKQQREGSEADQVVKMFKRPRCLSWCIVVRCARNGVAIESFCNRLLRWEFANCDTDRKNSWNMRQAGVWQNQIARSRKNQSMLVDISK